MDWVIAEAQGMSRDLFSAVAGNVKANVVESANWQTFADKHGADGGDEHNPTAIIDEAVVPKVLEEMKKAKKKLKKTKNGKGKKVKKNEDAVPTTVRELT